MNNKVYKIITDRFIQALEDGRIPWEKPWDTAGILPTNGFTGRQYSGVNILILGMMPYEQPYWLTYNQAKKAGGNVIKGEKSTPVVFWKLLYKDKETGEKLPDKKAKKWLHDEDKAGRVKTIPILRYYNVFNIDQCENLNPEKIHRVELIEREFTPIGAAERIVSNMPQKPAINHNGNGRAYYAPATDTVSMPKKPRFKSDAGYYSTLFHELIHSTGHKSRLNRDLSGGVMDKKSYSKEELIAEIGSAFLNNDAGILEPEFKNSTAYINGWLEAFQDEDNVRMIVYAAASAEKAANFILNR